MPTYLSPQNFMRPVVNPFNPHGTADDQIDALLDKTAGEADAAKRAQRCTARSPRA